MHNSPQSEFKSRVLSNFQQFMSMCQDAEGCEYFVECIIAYVESDPLSIMCDSGGDYSTFLEIVMMLYHEYEINPDILGQDDTGSPRRVKGLFDPARMAAGETGFDRRWFQMEFRDWQVVQKGR